jgi:hypothetical protein
MGILTILGFLMGRRQSILDIAASKHAIWLGLLFVLSAGFAREYDGEDLLHEPWHLLIPFAASLATSTLLYGVLWIVLRGWVTFPNEWQTFRAFVSLYWMTAPLAWIYAIPVERFLSPEEATIANFWFLAIVAAWRVVLIIRVVSVILHAAVIQAVYPVLFFADTVLITLMEITPRPIIELMGGVRLTQHERLIATITGFTMLFATLGWLIFAVGTVIVIFSHQRQERAPSLVTKSQSPVNRSAWIWGVVSLLIWPFVLPFTQPEQQRRWQVENAMRNGKIAEALAFMAQHEPRDFPPYWDPPPRIAYRFRPASELMDVLDELSQMDSPPGWMTREYHRKFEYHLEDYYEYWESLSDKDFDRVLNWIERTPLSDLALSIQQESMRVKLDSSDSVLKNRTSEQKERLRIVLQIEKWDPPPPNPEVTESEPAQPTPAEGPQAPPT